MTLTDFYRKLRSHDWYYERADDPRAYRNGRRNYTEIVEIAKETAEHAALLNDFISYHFQNGPTPKDPFEHEYMEWLCSLPEIALIKTMDLQATTAESNITDYDMDITEAMEEARRYIFRERRYEIEASITGANA